MDWREAVVNGNKPKISSPKTNYFGSGTHLNHKTPRNPKKTLKKKLINHQPAATVISPEFRRTNADSIDPTTSKKQHNWEKKRHFRKRSKEGHRTRNWLVVVGGCDGVKGSKRRERKRRTQKKWWKIGFCRAAIFIILLWLVSFPALLFQNIPIHLLDFIQTKQQSIGIQYIYFLPL